MESTFKWGCAVRVLCALVFLCTSVQGSDQTKQPAASQGDPEWAEIPAAEAGLPPLEKADLVKRVMETAGQARPADRWELHYRLKQIANPDHHFRNNDVDASVQIARSGKAWRYSVSHHDEANVRYSLELYINNGQATYFLRHDKSISLSNDVESACNYQPMHPLLPFLLPSIEAPVGVRPDQFTPARFSDLIPLLDTADAKLLPWRTKVNGRVCYVLETEEKLTCPVFKTSADADAWRRDHPDDWERCRLGGLGFVVDPSATSDRTSFAVITDRVAVDPEIGFRIVRYSKGRTAGAGEQQWISVFPECDVVFSFNRGGEQQDVPTDLLVTRYHPGDRNDGMQFLIETRLTVEQLSFAPKPKSIDAPSYPDGFHVIDSHKGIVYQVGDPPELIARLESVAARRKAFFDRLSQADQLPPLKGSCWINSEPMDLHEYRGRPVELYFWNIGCGPCLYELPRIEEQYQRYRQAEGSPQIILVHGHVPESMVEKVKSVLDEKGVTAPNVIDTPFKGPTWGQIHADYGVQSVPTRIRIGADGKILSNGGALISAQTLKTSLFAPK